MFGVARAAQQGMGIALIPLPISQTWFEEEWLFNFTNLPLKTKDKYYLVHHEPSESNASLELFIKWLLDTYKHLK